MLYQNKFLSVFNFSITILLSLIFLSTSKVLSFETSAKAAFILDQTTGTVLLEKNADQPLPPASMSKLMTLYMAFEYINQGRLELTEKLPVSDAAVKYRGSTMFLNTSDRVSYFAELLFCPVMMPASFWLKLFPQMVLKKALLI